MELVPINDRDCVEVLGETVVILLVLDDTEQRLDRLRPPLAVGMEVEELA